MYVGGRGNATARRYARFWNTAMHLGLLPRRWVTLEVRGRRTGRVTRFPLGMADVGGRYYLVSMFGECNWVQNVRASGGRATLRRRRGRPVRLLEIPAEQRALVIRRYVEKVPGGRPHIPVDKHESIRVVRDDRLELPSLPGHTAVIAHLSQRAGPRSAPMRIRLRRPWVQQ